MSEYINRDAAIEAVAYRLAINKDDYERAERQAVDWLPEAEEDVVKVVRCKDCKHRPIDTQEEGNGFDYEFPEEYGCVGYCEDGYYSQRFEDNFFCAYGERRDI